MSETDALRTCTRRLSQVLSGPDGSLALAFLQKLAILQRPGSTPEPPQRDGRSIGIWHRTDGGEFVRRPEAKADWHLWADVEVLPVTDGRRRVAVLGESAARGYFFDPAITFAGLVAECLGGIAGLDDVDVLDLARTSAPASDVLETLHEVASLRPDGLIVYAGNNWYYPDITLEERQQLADMVRGRGYSGSQRVFHALLVRRARDFLEELAGVARACRASVALVVPEFNLADWYEEPFLGCPALAGSGNHTWQLLRTQAEEALAAGEPRRAARIAEEMIQLDGGASVTAHRLLAAALLGEDQERAEGALKCAKDAAIGRFGPHSPRILTAVQDELRAGAVDYGFALVDLPATLRRAAGGRTPSREHFLDYCHLNWEGLALAGSETAAVLGSRLAGTDVEVRAGELRSRLAGPPRDKQALSCFLAAIHNAHFGQPSEIVRYLLSRALSFDDGIAEHFANYLDYQTRQAPNWVCESFARSALLPEVARYVEVTSPRLGDKLADHELRATMLELLAERGLADPAGYQALLISEHAGDDVDLLADVNRAPTWREHSNSPAQPQAFVVAPGQSSGSWLVLACPVDVDLAMVARLPAGKPAHATVTVLVNGESAGNALVGPEWHTVRITVPAHRWRTGLNTVQVHWPLRELDGDQLLEDGARTLERGGTPRTNPRSGHLCSLTATLRPAPASPGRRLLSPCH